MRTPLPLLAALLVLLAACAPKTDEPTGPTDAELLARVQAIDTSLFSGLTFFRISIAPDASWLLVDDMQDRDTAGALFISHWTAAGWQKPERAPFSNYSDLDLDGFITYDGKGVVFMSRGRATTPEDTARSWNLWYTELQDDGSWRAPKAISHLNTPQFGESYPTMDAQRRLYYGTDMPEVSGVLNTYQAHLTDASIEPQALPAPVNSDAVETHTFITATGDSLLYYSRRDEGNRDIYLAIRQGDGSWTAQRLNEKVNTPGMELNPYLFKGQLFFTRFDSNRVTTFHNLPLSAALMQ